MSSAAETILAIASPQGVSARAVVRLSGPDAHSLSEQVFTSNNGPLSTLKPFRRHEGLLQLQGDSPWPACPAAAYLFKAPQSYTREDMVELHCLGSPPLLSALLRQLIKAGARQAGPGEFTRRAFLNGRLDLTQAEAVLAMTSVERRAQVKLAARTLRGGISERIDQAKTGLLHLAAFVEAGIDFSEDEVDLLPVPDARARLDDARAVLDELRQRASRFQFHRSEPVVALRGAANAGKSTLLNALLGRRRAITSGQAGTTRDVIAVPAQLGSYTVRLLDVAGDKQAQDAIEGAALEQARQAIEAADLILHLVDPLSSKAPPSMADNELLIYTKADLVSHAPGPGIFLSALTGQGLDELKQTIEARLRESRDPEGVAEHCDFIATSRQLGLIDSCEQAIERASQSLAMPGEERWELAMVDIHEALDALGEITGAIATDDILDVIFGSFCIGK